MRQSAVLPGEVYSGECWIWSDCHFHHKNIIKYCGRPDNCDRLMRDAWRELVAPGDVIVNLGDLALGRAEQLSWLADMPGRKLLVKGNHDKLSARAYTDLGFVRVPPFSIPWMHDGQQWTVSFNHYPKDELVQFPRHLLCHGHIHDKLTGNPRMINLSVEHLSYRPVRLADTLNARLAELCR